MRIHGGVCDGLKKDDLAFRYNTIGESVKESSRGFAIQMDRPEGQGAFRIILDHHGARHPIRLLMEFTWPPSEVHVQEYFDLTERAIFNALGGTWQRVMAEARLRAQCNVASGDALSFMQSRLVNVGHDALGTIGSPTTFLSLKLHSTPTTQTEDSLEHPYRELTVELLHEDPKCLYLELMSQWKQVQATAGGVDLRTIRPIDRNPGEYVASARQCLQNWVVALGRESGAYG